MDFTSEYRKIRSLSCKIELFNKNIGKYVRLKITSDYDYVAEPIEIKKMECFFYLIGKGLTNHPIVSHPIGNIMEIIPMK